MPYTCYFSTYQHKGYIKTVFHIRVTAYLESPVLSTLSLYQRNNEETPHLDESCKHVLVYSVKNRIERGFLLSMYPHVHLNLGNNVAGMISVKKLSLFVA